MGTTAVQDNGGILSRATLSTIGLGVQGLARFAYTILIGRMAGEAALADASALLSVSVWMALAMPQGLGVAASRFLPTPDLAASAARQLTRWFWIASPALALLTVPIAFWIVGDIVSSLTCALLVFTYNAYVFTRGAMMGEDRVLRATIADIVSSILAVTALALVLFGALNWALLLPLAIGFGVFALMTRTRTAPGSVSREQKQVFGRFVRDTVIGGLAVGGLLPTTMVFVRAFDTPLQAGLFAAALSLATPANMVAQAVNQVLLPYFARILDDRSAMLRAQRKMFLLSTALFAIVFGLLALFAPFILSVIYGDRFAGGTFAMQVLLGVVFLISATTAPSAYLYASGQQRVYAVTWLVALIVGTVIMLVTTPTMGMEGALIGYGVGGGGGALAIIWFGNFPARRFRVVDESGREHAPKLDA